MMTPFEDELKRALQRQEPSADFTARVLARCQAATNAESKAPFWQRLWTMPTWRLGLATSAVALLMLGVGTTIYEQHEHALKGMAAKRQLLLAMRIAGTKLQQVQQRVNESE